MSINSERKTGRISRFPVPWRFVLAPRAGPPYSEPVMTFFRCSQFRILATLFLAAILSHSGLAEGDALKARPVKTWPKKAFDAPQIWTFFGEEFFPR